MERETDFLGGVFKIAVGIALGGALLWFSVSRYEAYQIQKALSEVSAQWQAESEAARKAQLRREADEWAERELGAIKARQRQAQHLEIQREQGRQASQLAREANEAYREKEAAWRAFYTQPSRCEHPESFDVNVECGNAYMKARRQFEAQWEVKGLSK